MSARVKRTAIVLLAAASTALTSCVGSGSTVDGFRLGVIVKCFGGVGLDAAAQDRGCAGYLKRATAALDAREPGHAAIVSSTMYTNGTQPEPIDITGDAPPPTPAPRHAGPNVTVFVFTLADGTTRATGVACVEGPSESPCVGVGSYPT